MRMSEAIDESLLPIMTSSQLVAVWAAQPNIALHVRSVSLKPQSNNLWGIGN